MSWNNVLPWKYFECSGTCKQHDPETGFVIHVEGCPIGIEVAEREAREQMNESGSVPRGHR